MKSYSMRDRVSSCFSFSGELSLLILKYLWNSFLHIGQALRFLLELIRHERQNECPHSVVMGILNKDIQMGQLSY